MRSGVRPYRSVAGALGPESEPGRRFRVPVARRRCLAPCPLPIRSRRLGMAKAGDGGPRRARIGRVTSGPPGMKFAFAGIDFLGGVFEALIGAGWTPIKLFTRPCDGLYDHNEVVVARARATACRCSSRACRPEDLDALARGARAGLGAGGGRLSLAGPGLAGPAAYGLNVHPSPLPTGRGPYPLFRAVADGHRTGASPPTCWPRRASTPATSWPRRASRSRRWNHETLLAKCQMASPRLATALAADLPGLWRRRCRRATAPTGLAPPTPTAPSTSATTSMRSCAGCGRSARSRRIARIGEARVFVAAAAGWREAHGHAPGTVVQRHRRHVVIAARDGYMQLQRWSRVPPGEAGELGR